MSAPGMAITTHKHDVQTKHRHRLHLTVMWRCGRVCARENAVRADRLTTRRGGPSSWPGWQHVGPRPAHNRESAEACAQGYRTAGVTWLSEGCHGCTHCTLTSSARAAGGSIMGPISAPPRTNDAASRSGLVFTVCTCIAQGDPPDLFRSDPDAGSRAAQTGACKNQGVRSCVLSWHRAYLGFPHTTRLLDLLRSCDHTLGT